MAVWMQIVGEKTTPESIDERVEECKRVITDIELDLTFLHNTLEPQTAYEISHKHILPRYWVYNKANWIMEKEQEAVRLYYLLFEGTAYKHDSLKITLYKDTLSISGPFAHFGHYGNIVQEEQLRNGYQKLVRQICTIFNVKEVVYFSEWCYYTDDFVTYQELKLFLNEIPEKQVKELNQIWNGMEYYIEGIKG